MDVDRGARSLSLEDIDLAAVDDFWLLPLEVRDAGLATLRRERPIAHFDLPPFLGPSFPVAPDEKGFWAVTRYEDVVEASRRPEDFSSARGATSILDLPPMFLEYFGGMINADDPKHARLRRIVLRAFTPKRLAALEAEVTRRANLIIDRLDGRANCDFMRDVASLLPLQIICDLMGIPADRYDYVLERTNVILGGADPEYVAPDQDLAAAVLTAGVELTALMTELGRERQAHPTEDVTSALVNAELDGERLSHDELASFFILLAVAGNETTRNAIGWGMKLLSDHPDQREAWQADFEGLAPTAVEEIVRWASPVIFMRRTTSRPCELGGQHFDAGEKLVLLYYSANRDETVFDHPERFDIRRSENRHVGFGGYGPHYCLGAHLARREITIMFRELFRRVPELEVGEPDRLRSNFINGIKHLPCTVGPLRA